MNLLQSKISGIGAYTPETKLTNQDLAKLVDTTDEWITERIGIKERRILKGEGRGISYMGERAIKNLLEKTNVKAEEIDLLILATVTPDKVFPATSNILIDKAGLTKAAGFDINVACSGFLYALDVADKYIKTGTYKKIIVLGADKMSSIIDYQDRNTCVLFGDAAACVLVEPTEEDNSIKDSILKVNGAGRKHLFQKAGGSEYPATIETVKNREHFVYQEGAVVFKHAITNMVNVCEKVMERNKLNVDNLDWLVPHQANNRIINGVGKNLGIDPKKVMKNIEFFGNTTSATIPLCLRDYEEKLKKGDDVILTAFGGGFSWGAIYLKWAY